MTREFRPHLPLRLSSFAARNTMRIFLARYRNVSVILAGPQRNDSAMGFLCNPFIPLKIFGSYPKMNRTDILNAGRYITAL